MLNLTERGVEIFINKAKNIQPFWHNYDLIIWRKDSSGFTNTNGMFKDNSWGIAEVVSVDSNGIWKLPKKYVRHFK
jgi:hypothetical protein